MPSSSSIDEMNNYFVCSPRRRCGDHLSPRRFPRAFFPNRRRGKYLQDRAWKRSLYTGWEQHYVQGPSRSMLPPLLGTQAMPKATASSTCEHRAPAHERLGFYVATCCAMELAVAPISHGRLHSTPRSSNQPVGIYSYCRCTWDDDHNQRYCCGPGW